MTDEMSEYLPTDSQPHEAFADLLADIADVFSDCTDSDGAATLLQVCLEMIDGHRGAVYLDDVAGRLEVAASTPDVDRQTPNDIVTDTLITRRTTISRRDPSTVSLAVPLRSRGRVIGVIELDLPQAGSPEVHVLNAIQSLADVAATTIDHVRTVDHSARLVGQLQSALDHRIVLEQAKGVVAERLRTDCRTAFAEIRNTARREQRPIGDVASDIVRSRTNGDIAH